MKNLMKEFCTALMATLSLAVLLCGIYPLVIWAIAQGVFPACANGSLITRPGKVTGSVLISQGFAGRQYFHPRPSGAGRGHDATSSGGSNLGPTSRKLIDEVEHRVDRYRLENGLPLDVPIPADAVTQSASGLDPHISVENARLQLARVARERGLSESTIREQIDIHTEGRFLGIIGEPRVHVLMLNMALDGILSGS
jgi:potassium-transporting ATPase KdpC subunit